VVAPYLSITIVMGKGSEFSTELKQVFFRVIAFVEAEKSGSLIPLTNTTLRLITMLGISKTSLFCLKGEFEEARQQQQDAQRPRRRTTSGPTTSHRKRKWSEVSSSFDDITNIPVPQPPLKKGHSGRRALVLSELGEDTIRYHFHLMLAEKLYPTLTHLLARLHADHPDFPVRNETSLWRQLKRLGFSYKSTSKAIIPLDSPSFVAQRAYYFRMLDELRHDQAIIYFHDETWSNVGEEKRSIWLDEHGKGRIRETDGKGKRLAISAMISEASGGFHRPSVDVWTCDVDHSMNSERFISWIDKTAEQLRTAHGPAPRICIIIDNATWHNELVDTAKPPKRSWRKDQLQKWLDEHRIQWNPEFKKAELLELAFNHLPPKRYKTNDAARYHNVEILRLPIKHCILNPIELAWAQLKAYVRSNNTRFRLADVRDLVLEYVEQRLDADTTCRFIDHARKAEDAFRAADAFLEDEIEPDLIDNNSDVEPNALSDDDDDSFF
jgi:hypothetical protein